MCWSREERDSSAQTWLRTLLDSHEVTVLDSFHTGSMDNLESVREEIRVMKG